MEATHKDMFDWQTRAQGTTTEKQIGETGVWNSGALCHAPDRVEKRRGWTRWNRRLLELAQCVARVFESLHLRRL